MNKTFRLIAVALMLLGMLMLPVTPAAAAEKTVYQCSEDFADAEGLPPGTVTVTNGGITQIRGAGMLLRDEGDSPLVTGYDTITFNANWDADGNGPIWGTAHFVTDEGGVWEGQWTGQAKSGGFPYLVHAVLNGSGKYAGMTLWWDKGFVSCQATVLSRD